ncbi:hypothetical protein J5J86_03980 [Aquabacter sp. L1I39]|uniref:hypothetical protein n=1 Tax=Aquabacter sp. L1I39 TaxID=2820278 RepID=UPI001ADC4CE3|nr:hypothetical protein [Aquabacter sp. L1I39]QTL04508.1 hypothetical protein J5J86_03980 [Aquabacter sp. L1I39]
MRTDSHPAARGRDRLACALFVFLVTLLVGGAAAAFLVSTFRERVEHEARRDATLIGTTVARALASQFEKAARFGIPLKLLPGVEAYLDETLSRTPGLTRIVLRGPDGRELRSAVGPAPGTDTVSMPIQVDGIQMGQVDVVTTPATLSSAFADLTRQAVLSVAVCAVLGAGAAAVFAGASLARSRRRLAGMLAKTADGDVDLGPPPAVLSFGAVGTAFRALREGVRRVVERQTAVQAYAEEILTVDFDGRLRPEVERLRRKVFARPGAKSDTPGGV